MAKTVFFVMVLLCPMIARAAPFVSAYRNPNGGFYPLKVVSELGTSGTPLVSAYRDSGGNWHPTEVVENICGLDASNAPIVCSNITQTMIGALNGVAGLDASGDATAPVHTTGRVLMGKTDWLGSWADEAKDDAYRGMESAIFGGVTDTGEGNNTWNPRSVFIQSDPYGPYSAGCALGTAMTGSWYAAQMPVSEQPPNAGAGSVVHVGGFDTVNHCLLNTNTPARLVLQVASYTANSAVLAQPLTAAQAAQIHTNMYITTNSPSPDVHFAAPTNGTLPGRNLYAGFVSAQPKAGDTALGVFAWDVPGSGTGASGQVPQTGTLDTVWSGYARPTVFLGGGAAGSTFATNEFFNISADDLTPSSGNKSLIHQFTRDEVDLNIIGTAPAHSILWTGFNMNAGGQPDALTSDSHQFYMGGNINHHLILDGGCGNWLLEANGVYIPNGNCGIGSNNTGQISQEWDQFIDGANSMRVLLWNSLSNTSVPAGWQQATVHFGPTVDGAPQQQGDPGGSKQGDIEFNPAIDLSRLGGSGFYQPYGGVGLCGYAANCGLIVDGSGSVQMPGSNFYLWGGGHEAQIDIGSYQGSLYVTPMTGYTSGAQMVVRMPMTAPSYIETLATPASSSAPCTAGQFEDDANYHYVCVAANTWKRVALSSW